MLNPQTTQIRLAVIPPSSYSLHVQANLTFLPWCMRDKEGLGAYTEQFASPNDHMLLLHETEEMETRIRGISPGIKLI